MIEEKEPIRYRHTYKFRCSINGRSEFVFIQSENQQNAQEMCNHIFGDGEFIHMVDEYHRETVKREYVIRIITQPITRRDDEKSNCNG